MEKKDDTNQSEQPEESARAAEGAVTEQGGTAIPAEKVADEAQRTAGGTRTAGGRSRRSQVPVGIVNILATFNNTQVTISDPRGAVIAWCNAGRAGFKGSRKSTAFAATVVGQEAARQAVGRGMHEVEIHVRGPGAGRESAIRALQSAGLNVTAIKDVTPVPHNGCRQRKRRRV